MRFVHLCEYISFINTLYGTKFKIGEKNIAKRKHSIKFQGRNISGLT